MRGSLKFRDLKVGTKFSGILVGIGASGKREKFIKIHPASSNRSLKIGISDQNWNAVRLSDGDLCGFAPTAEVKVLKKHVEDAVEACN